ncbi:MAG: GAF domain-containing sensor histidine kinase [Anaerolineales bacterium]|nr:GAF domain-containing sensor histidine kinase [Anaerolineales bacterium]
MSENSLRNIDQNTLQAISDATLSIANQVELDKVLQGIVTSARKLVKARYAALGVAGPTGNLSTFVHSGMTPAEVDEIPHFPRGLGLLGAIVQEQRTVRIDNIAADERSVGFPEGHPPMKTFLGVPLFADSIPVGNLYMTDKEGGEPFTEIDQQVVELLAAHAAVAIKNARLYEQVELLAVRSERDRIGMDLHDGVIQSIYAVGLTLDSIRLSLGEQNPAIPMLDMAMEGLNGAITDIRNFIMDLRPRRFHGDLGEGIRQLVREFQANMVIPVALDMQMAAGPLPRSLGRAVFLTTQEALANIARHAHARQVSVSLISSADEAKLTIKDDGRGFDVNHRKRTGHGLSNMATRARELGGRFRIESNLGEGTCLTFQVPIP